jgi:hypothetical protein
MSWKSMPALWAVLCWAVLLVPATAVRSSAADRPSGDRLLPAETRAYVSIANVADLEAGWRKTRLAQIDAEPAMKPFLDAARTSFDEALGDLREVADVGLTELQAVATGEVCLATVETADMKPALAALIGVDGGSAGVQELIAKIDAGLKRRGAEYAAREVSGGTIHTYRWKGRDGATRNSAYFLQGGLLAVSSQATVAEGLFARLAAPAEGDLASVAGYQDIAARCETAAAGLAPQLRWYLEPLAYGKLLSDEEPTLAVKHGFDAVKALGGTVNFDAPGCEFLARVAVYAPGPKEKGMRLVSLVPGSSAAPPDWVVDDVDSYTEINLNLAQAIDAVGGLFDDLVADGIEGTFEDILGDLASQDGPGVDVRKDLLPIIGPRIGVVSNHVEPVSLETSRTLIAIATSDEAAAAEIVKRLMRDDADVGRHKLPGFPHELWQVKDSESATFPNMGMMVANGHVLVTNHGDLIRKLLLAPEGTARLSAAADHALVAKRMTQLGAAEASLRLFTRPAREFAATYASIRAGKLDDDDSLTGDVVRRLFGRDDVRLPGLPKLDFSKLPDFEAVKPYLKPQGIFIKNEPTGWMIVGFVPRSDE